MIILFIGAPGCGKGTQSEIISKKFEIVHFSSGDFLRQLAKSNSNISTILDQGNLIPDNLVNTLIVNKIKEIGAHGNVLLDGFPRNVNQALVLQEHYFSNLIIFFLYIHKEVLIQRIIGRFSCNTCGKLYNTYLNNVKIPGICDVCGGKEFSTRKEDTLEIFDNRYNIFEQETIPVVEFYKKNYTNNFYTIKAHDNIHQISQQISNVLDKNNFR